MIYNCCNELGFTIFKASSSIIRLQVVRKIASTTTNFKIFNEEMAQTIKKPIKAKPIMAKEIEFQNPAIPITSAKAAPKTISVKSDSEQNLSPRIAEFRKKMRETTDIKDLGAQPAANPGEEKEPLQSWPDNINPNTGEHNGPRGPEPTRYGDWERKGRVSDF